MVASRSGSTQQRVLQGRRNIEQGNLIENAQKLYETVCSAISTTARKQVVTLSGSVAVTRLLLSGTSFLGHNLPYLHIQRLLAAAKGCPACACYLIWEGSERSNAKHLIPSEYINTFVRCCVEDIVPVTVLGLRP